MNEIYALDIRCVKLTPYKVDDTVVLDVQSVIPLPEAEDYLIHLKRRQIAARAAMATSNMSHYVITTPDGDVGPLNKRRAVLEMVKRLVGAGVQPSSSETSFAQRSGCASRASSPSPSWKRASPNASRTAHSAGIGRPTRSSKGRDLAAHQPMGPTHRPHPRGHGQAWRRCRRPLPTRLSGRFSPGDQVGGRRPPRRSVASRAVARRMVIAGWRHGQWERRYDEHIAPVNCYVDELRDVGRGWAPSVSPLHGGVNRSLGCRAVADLWLECGLDKRHAADPDGCISRGPKAMCRRRKRIRCAPSA